MVCIAGFIDQELLDIQLNLQFFIFFGNSVSKTICPHPIGAATFVLTTFVLNKVIFEHFGSKGRNSGALPLPRFLKAIFKLG
jgi:hypothetical protein